MIAPVFEWWFTVVMGVVTLGVPVSNDVVEPVALDAVDVGPPPMDSGWFSCSLSRAAVTLKVFVLWTSR